MQINPRSCSYIAGTNMCAGAIREGKVIEDGPPLSNFRWLNILRSGEAFLFHVFHFLSPRVTEVYIPRGRLEPTRNDHTILCISEVKIPGALGRASALVAADP